MFNNLSEDLRLSRALATPEAKATVIRRAGECRRWRGRIDAFESMPSFLANSWNLAERFPDCRETRPWCEKQENCYMTRYYYASHKIIQISQHDDYLFVLINSNCSEAINNYQNSIYYYALINSYPTHISTDGTN